MKKEGRIFVVDDNRNMLEAVKILLDGLFEQVTTPNSPNRLISTLQQERPDVLLLDMHFSAGLNSGNEGLYLLDHMRAHDSTIEVVLFTARGDDIFWDISPAMAHHLQTNNI